jgi:hypothetical protein
MGQSIYSPLPKYTRMNIEFLNHHKKGTKVERRKIEEVN